MLIFSNNIGLYEIYVNLSNKYKLYLYAVMSWSFFGFFFQAVSTENGYAIRLFRQS